MKIELKNDEPVYHKPYRLSKSDREKILELVVDLQTNGIVRESTSPYSSPVVLVRKRNWEIRMAVDYRAVNRKTKIIKFPLPIIEDQIDQLCNKEMFTSLDLKSGFRFPCTPIRWKKRHLLRRTDNWSSYACHLG